MFTVVFVFGLLRLMIFVFVDGVVFLHGFGLHVVVNLVVWVGFVCVCTLIVVCFAFVFVLVLMLFCFVF